MSTITVVVGGQFGSEAKGAVAAWLSRRQTGALVRVAGPNAGHTVWGGRPHQEFKLQQIPAGAVVNHSAAVVIAAGSEIEQAILEREVFQLERAQIPIRDRLYVDREATVIEPHHADIEKELTGRIGSTGKGVGAARSSRIMRNAERWDERPWNADTQRMLQKMVEQGASVLIEGTQGYGLGLHAGYYPKCTSSDCRAIDFLSMTGISPWTLGVETEVWVVVRTRPIRVAGDSGPLLGETSWEKLGVAPEITTVTKKVRRVGVFDSEQVREALRANGAPSRHVRVALTFVDYDLPHLAGQSWRNTRDVPFDLANLISDYEQRIGHRIDAVSTGPGAITPERATWNRGGSL